MQNYDFSFSLSRSLLSPISFPSLSPISLKPITKVFLFCSNLYYNILMNSSFCLHCSGPREVITRINIYKSCTSFVMPLQPAWFRFWSYQMFNKSPSIRWPILNLLSQLVHWKFRGAFVVVVVFVTIVMNSGLGNFERATFQPSQAA